MGWSVSYSIRKATEMPEHVIKMDIELVLWYCAHEDVQDHHSEHAYNYIAVQIHIFQS